MVSFFMLNVGLAHAQNDYVSAPNNGIQSYLGTLYCYGGTNACDYNVCSDAAGPSGYFPINLQDTQDYDIAYATVPVSFQPGNYYSTCSATPGELVVQVYESPADITGVQNYATGGTTFSVGSGYMILYGYHLDADGATPNPKIVADDPTHITLMLSYVSDTQINLAYTISSGAAVGKHSVSDTTSAGTGSGTFNVSN